MGRTFNFENEFLHGLENIFGSAVESRTVSAEGKPAITLYFFRRETVLTAVTCGLSNAALPEWTLARPELMISLETSDMEWGICAAKTASKYFGESLFTYGSVFEFDFPISAESEMCGFLEYAPASISMEQARIITSDRKIVLAALYPLYKSEISAFAKNGFDAFFSIGKKDLLNTKRENIE